MVGGAVAGDPGGGVERVGGLVVLSSEEAGVRPRCKCHGAEMLPNRNRTKLAWRCAVKHREREQAYYHALDYGAYRKRQRKVMARRRAAADRAIDARRAA